MSTRTVPVVAVVYDTGAVDPREIIAAARGAVQVVFVCGAPPGSRALMTILKGLAPTFMLSDSRTPGRLGEAGVSGVVTFCDALVSASGDLAARLGVPHNSPAVCKLLNDKHAQRLALSAAGLDHVCFARVEGAGDLDRAIAAVGLPAVLKPTHAHGSRATYPLWSQADATSVRPAIRDAREPFILESYLAGQPGLAIADYISVETLAIGGDYQHYGVSGKLPLVPPFREAGGFLPADADSSVCQAATAVTDRALRALNVTEGFIHTELKLTSAGPRVIEVNGRLGGWMHDLYQRHAQVDLVRIALLAASGQHPHIQLRPQEGVVFQFSNLAPVEARRLIRGSAIRAIGEIKGVVRYTRLMRDGQAMAGGTATSELDLALCAAATHGEMFAIARQVAMTAAFTFADGSGQSFSRTGRDLPSWVAVQER